MRVGEEGVLSNASVPAATSPCAPQDSTVGILVETFQVDSRMTVSTVLDEIKEVLVDHPDRQVNWIMS